MTGDDCEDSAACPKGASDRARDLRLTSAAGAEGNDNLLGTEALGVGTEQELDHEAVATVGEVKQIE